MIGQSLLRKGLAQGRYGAQVVSATNRNFAGGGNKPKPIDPKTTDYDILFVGKYNLFVMCNESPRIPMAAFAACYSTFLDVALSGVEVVSETMSSRTRCLTKKFRWNQRNCSLEAHSTT